MEIHQTLTNNLTAANKNLEVLKAHFGHCFDKQGNFLMEKFQAELQAGEVNFSKESYGLDWLGRSYARLLASDAATTLLKEDEAFNQKPENVHSQNLLLKGDNLEILKHLSHAYFEKVKMIYIDPPYNTGGDGFVYQDDRKFTVTELQRLAGVSEEKAKRILDFTMSKSNSHSAWLTFMYPRLYIAKQLLKDDGVIFVSIDDNEVAQLRLLMDEVFGEDCFVALITLLCNPKGRSQDKYFATNHEYILVYSKTPLPKGAFAIAKEEEQIEAEYPEEDDGGKYRLLELRNTHREFGKQNRRNLFYPLYANSEGEVFIDGDDTLRKVLPVWDDGFEGCWTWERAKAEKDIELLVAREISGRWKIYRKSYANGADRMLKTIFTDKSYYTERGQKFFNSLLETKTKLFQSPKSPYLISQLTQTITIDSDIILDFFAGSGTTGDAVMQLNAEDGGRRKFILAQLPEKIDPSKSKASYDFVKNELGVEVPTIFEITKERLIRAAKKLREERPVEVAGQDLGFKVFETIPLWEDYHHKAETLEEDTPAPFRGDLLGVDDLQALFLTWKTYDGSPLTEEAVDCDLGGYVGKYVNGKLYLMSKGFTTDHLVAMLQKVDSDPEFNPRAVIVFESNFQSKNLLELGESLQNFPNHKSLEIDFIMRF